MIKTLSFSTREKFQLIDLTDDVKEIVENSRVKNGLCIVYTPHATGAVIINESADPELKKDIIEKLEEIIPSNKNYRHDRIDNNAQAHIKTSLLSPSQTIPVVDGKLALGTWQAIFFAEFDGPRKRNLLVKVIEG